jgi:hypothetical protein
LSQKEQGTVGASHNIKLGQDNGMDIGRGAEANDAPADCFVLITDENDRLYCPGVNDEPSANLVQSMRNGWEKGSTLKCVNRGKKGKAPILAIGEGRSRLKAVHIVNTERAEAGMPLIRPQFVLMTEDDAYEAMHTSANKQERKPTFEARCWAQYKRIFALEKFGKTALEDSEAREARKAYSELRKCTAHQIKAWEQILSAHPEVLRAFDNKEPGMIRAAVLDIVNSTAYADQPKAARKVIELAKRKNKPEEQPQAAPQAAQNKGITHSELGQASPDHEFVNPPEKQNRGTRSERSDRRKALGIGAARPITTRKLAELLVELRKVEDADLVDPRVMLAFVLGETEFDGLPIADHPSMGEVVRLAKRVGIEVAK